MKEKIETKKLTSMELQKLSINNLINLKLDLNDKIREIDKLLEQCNRSIENVKDKEG